MRNAVRALMASIAAGAVLIPLAPPAQANILDDIVVAHRAGATTRYGEGTMKSYKFSVANKADVLDGDIHWTKDSPNDKDTLGSILVIQTCSRPDHQLTTQGKVSSWLWTSIQDKCRTDIGKQRLIRLKDLIAGRDSQGKRSPSGSRTRRSPTRKQSSCGTRSKYSDVQLKRPPPGWMH